MPDSMPRGPAAPPPPPEDAPLQEWTAHLLAVQAVACRLLGSMVYAHLLDRAAEDVRAGGASWTVLEPHATKDPGAALPLRLMAAVHRLVLTGRAPRLAEHFASAGGTLGAQGAWPALRALLTANRDDLQRLVALPCQTNEVGRCAALVGGFLLAARSAGMPLRLLEIGASAGLNLRWDDYRYEHTGDGRSWGASASTVRLRGHWDVPVELLDTPVQVAARHGCDPSPVDPLDHDGRLRLSSAVWGDQPVRFQRLRAALDVAAHAPAEVDAARAIAWLPERLARGPDGAATVVFHSLVTQYLAPDERAQVIEVIRAAGERATPHAPLFWLRMEPERPLRAMAVRLTAWPGDDERLVATAGAHGHPVRWRL